MKVWSLRQAIFLQASMLYRFEFYKHLLLFSIIGNLLLWMLWYLFFQGSPDVGKSYIVQEIHRRPQSSLLWNNLAKFILRFQPDKLKVGEIWKPVDSIYCVLLKHWFHFNRLQEVVQKLPTYWETEMLRLVFCHPRVSLSLTSLLYMSNENALIFRMSRQLVLTAVSAQDMTREGNRSSPQG
jgi:hypothetical protein